MRGVDDIRLKTDFFSRWNNKVESFREKHGAEGLLGLIELWCYTGQNRPDGNLMGLSDEQLDRIMRVSGLTKQLALANFLDGDEGARQVHQWAEHQPWATGADARRERAKHNAKAGWITRRNDGIKQPSSQHHDDGMQAPMLRSRSRSRSLSTATTCAQPTSAAGVDGHELPLEANGNGKNGLPKMFLNGTTIEQVYEAYPRHVARPAALKAIAKAGQAHPSGLSGLLADVRAYAHSAKVQDLRALGKTHLIPHPATWMNQRRWEDDRKEWEQVSGDAPETEEQTINRLLREGSPA